MSPSNPSQVGFPESLFAAVISARCLRWDGVRRYLEHAAEEISAGELNLASQLLVLGAQQLDLADRQGIEHAGGPDLVRALVISLRILVAVFENGNEIETAVHADLPQLIQKLRASKTFNELEVPPSAERIREGSPALHLAGTEGVVPSAVAPEGEPLTNVNFTQIKVGLDIKSVIRSLNTEIAEVDTRSDAGGFWQSISSHIDSLTRVIAESKDLKLAIDLIIRKIQTNIKLPAGIDDRSLGARLLTISIALGKLDVGALDALLPALLESLTKHRELPIARYCALLLLQNRAEALSIPHREVLKQIAEEQFYSTSADPIIVEQGAYIKLTLGAFEERDLQHLVTVTEREIKAGLSPTGGVGRSFVEVLTGVLIRLDFDTELKASWFNKLANHELSAVRREFVAGLVGSRSYGPVYKFVEESKKDSAIQVQAAAWGVHRAFEDVELPFNPIQKFPSDPQYIDRIASSRSNIDCWPPLPRVLDL